MAEYIDCTKCRDDFYNGILDVLSDDDTNDRANEIIDIFDELPTADVEPVRRGHWVWKRRPTGGIHRYTGVDDMGEEHTVTINEHRETVVNYCSECGKRGDDTFLRYCPNCGAKMDKKEMEENV